MIRHGMIAVGLGLLIAGQVIGGQFQEKTVAKSARWVLHVDCDQLRGTTVAKAFRKRVQNNPQKAAGLETVQNLLQLKPRRDFHAVTLYGPDRNREKGILVLGTDYDKDAILAVLQARDSYRKEQFQSWTLHHVRANKNARKGKGGGKSSVWGCFYGDQRIVIGRVKERVQHALMVLDGQKPSLADSDKAVWDNMPGGTPIVAAGANVADVAQLDQKAKLLRDSKGLVLSMDEAEAQFTVRVKLIAADRNVAARLKEMAEGILAWVAEQKEGRIGKIAENATVSQEDNIVQLVVKRPADEVAELIKQKGERGGGTTNR